MGNAEKAQTYNKQVALLPELDTRIRQCHVVARLQEGAEVDINHGYVPLQLPTIILTPTFVPLQRVITELSLTLQESSLFLTGKNMAIYKSIEADLQNTLDFASEALDMQGSDKRRLTEFMETLRPTDFERWKRTVTRSLTPRLGSEWKPGEMVRAFLPDPTDSDLEMARTLDFADNQSCYTFDNFISEKINRPPKGEKVPVGAPPPKNLTTTGPRKQENTTRVDDEDQVQELQRQLDLAIDNIATLEDRILKIEGRSPVGVMGKTLRKEFPEDWKRVEGRMQALEQALVDSGLDSADGVLDLNNFSTSLSTHVNNLSDKLAKLSREQNHPTEHPRGPNMIVVNGRFLKQEQAMKSLGEKLQQVHKDLG